MSIEATPDASVVNTLLLMVISAPCMGSEVPASVTLKVIVYVGTCANAISIVAGEFTTETLPTLSIYPSALTV